VPDAEEPDDAEEGVDEEEDPAVGVLDLCDVVDAELEGIVVDVDPGCVCAIKSNGVKT
jgi:hypothetical protein